PGLLRGEVADGHRALPGGPFGDQRGPDGDDPAPSSRGRAPAVLGRRAPRARLLSAGVAAGLVYSGLSNTCGMAALLGKLPFNRPTPAVLDTARAALRA
ncbi:hypothetical protein ABZ203_30300, partial [Streptomyces albidoflavus]